MIGGSIARIFLEAQFRTVFLSSVAQGRETACGESLADVVESSWSVYPSWSRSGGSPPDAWADIHSAAIPTSIQILRSRQQEAIETLVRTVIRRSMVGVVAVNVPPLASAPLYQSLKLRLMKQARSAALTRRSRARWVTE